MSLSPRPSDAELLERARMQGYHAEQRAVAARNAQGTSPFDPTLAAHTTTVRDAATRTKKRERNEEEHEMQVALVTWCRTGEGSVLAPALRRIIAIPNGGSATKMMNIRMWKEGRARGFPDLFLPVALGGFHGAMLELKRLGEVPTAEQFEWLHSLAAAGYATSWSDALDAAQAWLLRYGQLPPTRALRDAADMNLVGGVRTASC